MLSKVSRTLPKIRSFQIATFRLTRQIGRLDKKANFQNLEFVLHGIRANFTSHSNSISAHSQWAARCRLGGVHFRLFQLLDSNFSISWFVSWFSFFPFSWCTSFDFRITQSKGQFKVERVTTLSTLDSLATKDILPVSIDLYLSFTNLVVNFSRTKRFFYAF